MPKSKQRKHHHESHRPAGTAGAKKSRSAVTVAVIFFALFGMGIAYFATGTAILWLIVGAIAGGTGGYFFGKQIDRSLSKK